MSIMDNKSHHTEEPYVLYYNDFSICSLMVRFTLALCDADSSKTRSPLRVDEKKIDIQHGGQLEEYYLCEINPKGTVPVLAHATLLDAPITESLDITHELGKMCSHLYPTELSDQINLLLRELHVINFFSLTYTRRPQRAEDMQDGVLKLLADPSISPRYRKALEYKLQMVQQTRAPALASAYVEAVEEETRTVLSKISALLEGSSSQSQSRSPSPWIFGTAEATALDAHTVPFLSRLIDVGRENMLDDRTRRYADRIFAMEPWQKMMDGRQTVYGKYL